LFVGRIEPLKGIDTLLQAAADMQQAKILEKENLCILIIGGEASTSEDQMSHEMARLMEVRDELGLQSYVEFLGKRPQDSLPYYYSAAEIVVVPSHYESFGMVALEAMACGTPVVASQVGGLAYLVQDGVTGFHVPDQEPKAMEESLMKILGDEKLHAAMSDHAAEYAVNYAWSNIASQMQNIYQDLINTPK
jgi:D-inositol-3-phosphate glycosyltransferase